MYIDLKQIFGVKPETEDEDIEYIISRQAQIAGYNDTSLSFDDVYDVLASNNKVAVTAAFCLEFGSLMAQHLRARIEEQVSVDNADVPLLVATLLSLHSFGGFHDEAEPKRIDAELKKVNEEKYENDEQKMQALTDLLQEQYGRDNDTRKAAIKRIVESFKWALKDYFMPAVFLITLLIDRLRSA